MNRILVPTDFSKISENALDVAIEIAEKFDAEIYFLNVIQRISSTGFSAAGSAVYEDMITDEERFILELHRVNEAKLYDIIGTKNTGDVNVYPMISIDEMEKGITNFIEKYHIDLVVMGTSGENTLMEYFIGNNTERIIRITHCPVLAVRKPTQNFQINNLVLATDLNRKAYGGMSRIKKFMSYFDCKLHLVYVAKKATGSMAETKERVKAFAEEHQLEDYTINVVHNTDLERGILHFAGEVKADIIVTITHGRKGLAHLVFGSISEHLIREANMPVLTVHFDD
ncbi:universal stress protein [Fulvivirgaceae bacterium BMA10]|uniref:Universal stress protein n=1 Tax=Splendidivirga corallicola TaxID=3051826 RepID=A0ABT8KX25_9BACT|nr:universal stress protein [Fulvivirgaceae bacterium BMA10]